jgi:hypothetical protein
MLKNAIFTLLFCCAYTTQAQQIAFKLDFNPNKPFVFAHPDKNKVLFLFARERPFDNGVFAGHIFERNTDNLKTIVQEKKISLPAAAGNDVKLRQLCQISRPDAAFFAVENNDQCRVYRLSWDSLTVEETDAISFGKGERFITGLSNGPVGGVIGYQQTKKDGHFLNIYEVDAAGKLQKHDFLIPEQEQDDFERIFKRSFGALNAQSKYRPLSVEYGMEHDPQAASRKPKLFIDAGILWMALDEESNDLHVLKLYTFDLKRDTMILKRHGYGSDVPVSGMKGASYIFDGKIFQTGSSGSELLISIRDLWTGNMVQTHRYHSDDSLSFANSPLLIPGRGSLGIEKEYSSTKKFLKRFKPFTPFIQVRKQGNEYLMCIGGYEWINTYSQGAMNPTTGRFGPGMSMTYERAFAFYSAVNATNLFRSSTRFDRTLVSYYADMSQAFDGVTDEAILHIGEHHYLGAYYKDTDSYVLRKVK